jgi:hypothetical protein
MGVGTSRGSREFSTRLDRVGLPARIARRRCLAINLILMAAFAANFVPRRRIATFELWAFQLPDRSRHPHENRDKERTATFVAAETRAEALALAPPAPGGCEWRVVSELRPPVSLV